MFLEWQVNLCTVYYFARVFRRQNIDANFKTHHAVHVQRNPRSTTQRALLSSSVHSVFTAQIRLTHPPSEGVHSSRDAPPVMSAAQASSAYVFVAVTPVVMLHIASEPILSVAKRPFKGAGQSEEAKSGKRVVENEYAPSESQITSKVKCWRSCTKSDEDIAWDLNEMA